MSVNSDCRRPVGQGQAGYALLLTLLVLVLSATAILLEARPERSQGAAREARDMRLLARARDALLDYAAFGGKNHKPGALPCPDRDTPPDGKSDSFCQGNPPDAVYMGRLPWKTIDLAEQFNAEAPNIWIAFDGTFQDDYPPPLNPDNSDSDDLDLELNELPYAAVLVMGRGPTSPDQLNFGIDDRRRYLESDNADVAPPQADESFIDCSETKQCNDLAIGIKAEDLMMHARMAVIGRVRKALIDYRDSKTAPPYFPTAAELNGPDDTCVSGKIRGELPVGADTADDEDEPESYKRQLCGGDRLLPDWVPENEWHDYLYYAVSSECVDSESQCADAAISDLLTLDSREGQAVVFGIPEDIAEYDNQHPESDNAFEQPSIGSGKPERMHAISAP